MALTKVTNSMIAGADVYAIDFGAVDGADNTAAIVAALASIVSGAGAVLHIPKSIISAVIGVTKADVTITSDGQKISFAAAFTPGAASPTGPDGNNVLFAVSADRVKFSNCSFNGTDFVTPTSGGMSFLWYAFTGGSAAYGQVDNCYFEDQKYLTPANGVAIQGKSGAVGLKITNCTFINCAGSVSGHGQGTVIDNCFSYITSAQLTNTAGTTDQAYGLDGCQGGSITNCKVVRASAAAPFSGANIGFNSGSTDFTCANNYILGLTAGVGLFIRGSSYGSVVGNVISGGDFVSVGVWALARIDTDSAQVVFADNVLKSPPTTTNLGVGLDVYTGGNIVKNNMFALGSATNVKSGISVREAATPGVLLIDGNNITCANTGIELLVVLNGTQPISLKNNIYAGLMTTPYNTSAGSNLNIPIYVEQEVYTDPAVMLTYNIPKFLYGFASGQMANYLFKINQRSEFYSVVPPSTGAWSYGSWNLGDTCWKANATVGQPVGWKCTVAGTYGTATEAGTATSGSKVITALADTSDFNIGDYVNASAGFATLTALTITAIVANTSITVNRTANASGASTLSHLAPTWTAMANL